MMSRKKSIKIVSIALLALVLCHCQHIGWQSRVTHQGNVITAEQISQLHVGMHKAEVVAVMGSPVLVNTFDDSRWNYVYRVHKSNKIIEKKTIVIQFAPNDQVIHIER